MAKIVLGKEGMESTVRAKPVGEAVLLLARSYDKLVRELEYELSHLSEENLCSELRERIKEAADAADS